MPKDTVTDPITDQEVAFARLLLSGTMNDRDAAEAVGLKPSTAAYTKSKPHVRAHMMEHSRDQIRDQIRGQILDRLWQLANLNPEQTRGSIAGQIKAMSMIVAVEGLIPNHLKAQPAAPPVKAQIYVSEAQRRRQAEGERSQQAETAVEEQPVNPQAPERASPSMPAGDALSPNLDHTNSVNPFVYPERTSWVSDTMGATHDPTGPFRLPVLPGKSALARNR